MGKGGIGKTFMWILMGLLILGLAGFAVTDLSGTVRSIGKVGEADISTTARQIAVAAATSEDQAGLVSGEACWRSTMAWHDTRAFRQSRS